MRGNSIISPERRAKIKNRTAQWKAYKPEENPLFGLDESQLVGLLGLNEDPEQIAAELEKAGGEMEADVDQSTIPRSFDSRTKWPGCVGAIRNQGSCGSCWAFSSVTSLQDRFCIATGGKVNVPLSPQ